MEKQTVTCACCAREVIHVDTECEWCDDCWDSYESEDGWEMDDPMSYREE